MAIYNPQRGVYTDTPDSAGAVPIQPPPSAPPNPATAAALPPSAPPGGSIRNEGPSNPNYPAPQYNTPSPAYPTSAPPPAPVATQSQVRTVDNLASAATPSPVTTPPPPPVPSVTPPTTAGAIANGAAPNNPTFVPGKLPTSPGNGQGIRYDGQGPGGAQWSPPPPVSNYDPKSLDGGAVFGKYPHPGSNQVTQGTVNRLNSGYQLSQPGGAPITADVQRPGQPGLSMPAATPAQVSNMRLNSSTDPRSMTYDPSAAVPGITKPAAGSPFADGGTNLFAGDKPGQYSNAGGSAYGPAGPTPDASGITRVGNSFSGSNIKFAGGPTPEQSAAAHAANMAGYAQDSQHLQDMLSLRAAADKNQIMGAGGGGVLGSSPGDYVGGIGMSKAESEKFHDEANLRWAASHGSWSPRGGYKSDEGAIQAALAPIQNRAKLAEMSLKNQGDLRSAQLQAETARRGQDITAGTARAEQAVQARGQDVQRYGHELTYGAAAQKNAFEARKDARDYATNQEHWNAEQGFKNTDENQKATKAMAEQFGNRWRTKDDKGNDVADTARVAEGMQAAGAMINSQIATLNQQYPKGSPGYDAAQKTIDELRTKGPQALGPDKIDRISDLLDIKDRIRKQSSNINTWQGRFAESNNPEDYVITGMNQGSTQDQFVHKNGSTSTARSMTYTGGGNAIIPNALGDSPTDKFAKYMKPDMSKPEGRALAKYMHERGVPGY